MELQLHHQSFHQPIHHTKTQSLVFGSRRPLRGHVCCRALLPPCRDAWSMAGLSAPCSEDGPARGRRRQCPAGSEWPFRSHDAVAGGLRPRPCSDSAAGLPALARPRPGAGGSRESLAAPVCGQGSRTASSRPFHLWLPEFTGLIFLTCSVPGARATPGAMPSGRAALARPGRRPVAA